MSQKKILVIDDEFPVRYLVEHQLRRNDFEVRSAKDGPSGFKTAYMHQPDLIVLDVMMPGMDGFQVCQKIRNTPETAAIPVIFLTACMTKQHKLQAFKAGGDDYLVKPFQPDELLAHITAVLRRTDNTHNGNENIHSNGHGSQGRVVSLYSPKGGVGTTTLAIQLSEAVVIREGQPVVLIDLDLPLGGIAPMLNLYNERHVVDLLSHSPEHITPSLIKRYTQKHRVNLLVIPAPSKLTLSGAVPRPASLKPLIDSIVATGYQVILDLGSTLSDLTMEALRLSDLTYVVTSGRPVANKLHSAFMKSAPQMGLETRRLLPVINELHGPVDKLELTRVPVARIPHASEISRTKLWLRDQGLQKLVSVML